MSEVGRRVDQRSLEETKRMNAQDVLRYGHLTMLHTLAAVPQTEWETQGVCGNWSVKNIVDHLASYEWVLVDVMNETLGRGRPTPYLDELRQAGAEAFNDSQVERRRDQTAEQALAEYNAGYAAVQELAAVAPGELWCETGRIPWYGMEYAIDDLIVYQYYGHKREHMAQVAVFRDQRDRQASTR
jgi:hypothetical protein